MFSDADGVNDEWEGAAETEREREGSVERGEWGLSSGRHFAYLKVIMGNPMSAPRHLRRLSVSSVPPPPPTPLLSAALPTH